MRHELFCAAAAVLGLGGSAQAITYTELFKADAPSGLTISGGGLAPAAGGQMAVSARGSSTANLDQAFLYNNSSTPIPLNPSQFSSSTVNGVGGGYQVGNGYGNATFRAVHALLWHGTNTPIDLNPVGFGTSSAGAVYNGWQVGNGTPTGSQANHALLWHGSNVAIDLHPTGFINSAAFGTDGVHQVGDGTPDTPDLEPHALLWNGTNVATDLHPVGYTNSFAQAVSGNQQVGSAFHNTTSDSIGHAMLWTGSAASAIDLNPSKFLTSGALGTNGTLQVGYGLPKSGNFPHALLWTGSAASAIDLGAMLPPTYFSSWAYAIVGDTIYGTAYDNNTYHAITWTVPEPTSLALLSVAGGMLLRRKRV